METEALKKLYKSNRTANAVFKTLAGMKRNEANTDLRRLFVRVRQEHNAAFAAEDFKGVFAAIQKAGVGKLKPGKVYESAGGNRQQHPDRFEWSSGSTDIFRQILSEVDPGALPPVIKRVSSQLAPRFETPGFKDYFLQLDEGMALLHLPTSLSPKSRKKLEGILTLLS